MTKLINIDDSSIIQDLREYIPHHLSDACFTDDQKGMITNAIIQAIVIYNQGGFSK